MVPGEILATPSARHLDIAICLLDANEATQTARLRSRGEPGGVTAESLGFRSLAPSSPLMTHSTCSMSSPTAAGSRCDGIA